MTDLAGVGVVCHLIRPTLRDCAEMAAASEDAGADWILMPDCLGWRDTWLILAEAARATSRIRMAPAVTNPYTRHPFITLEALATFYEMSGGRAFLGVGAGGSELPTYAGISRTDAPDRVRELVRTIRRASAGDADLPLAAPVPDVPIMGGARKRRMLETVGEWCDVALLSGQPQFVLEEQAVIVAGGRAVVSWSPLRWVDSPHVRIAGVYGILNSAESVRRRLGVDPDLEARLRERLAATGMDGAAELVPESAIQAFVIDDEPTGAASLARRMGAESIAVQAFATDEVAERVGWARKVVNEMETGPGNRT
jgi:5,10-methylenetetrahydromethanopterin reductase